MKSIKIDLNLRGKFEENTFLYIITLICFCTGIVLGIYSVKYMGVYEKTDLCNYILDFFNKLKDSNISSNGIFLQTIKNNLIIIIIIWFLGLTIIGTPIILLLNLFKGFSFGFSIGFVLNQMGTKGIWLAVINIVPQNLIYLPCIVISSVLAMDFSIKLLNMNSYKSGKNCVVSSVTSYTFNFLIITLIMFIGFFFEAYIAPNIMKFLV
ncbi:stage II sporulation protein M [Clostridium sp. DL1XJH146]